MNGLFKAGLFAAASLSALSASAARAQDAPAQAPSPAPASSQVQDIVVTAQFREQKLIDVPITITALTGKQLTEYGVQDLHDLSLHTPGFYVQNQSVNDPGIVMRGVTTDSTDPTNEPRVSIFQDGVYISQVPAANVALFDIERVEVAKGPQTALYGRAALTGAVNIIDDKANERGFDWSFLAETGNYNEHLLQGMVNVPLASDFAVRVALYDDERDGFIKNDLGGDALNGVSTRAGRVSFNYRPSAQLNDDLIVNFQYDDPSGVDFKNTTFYPSNPTTGQVLGNLSPFSSAALDGSPVLENGAFPNDKREIESVTNILSYRISDSLKLTSTSAFRHYWTTELFDPDGFSFPILTGLSEGRGTEISQDFRLNYDPGGKFSAFAGVNAFGDSEQGAVSLAFDEPVALALVTGALNRTNPNAGPASAYTNTAVEEAELQGTLASVGLSVPSSQLLGLANNLNQNQSHLETSEDASHTEAYDVYLDATYRLTEKFEITGGIRYSDTNKTSKFASSVDSRSILGGLIGVTELAAPAKLNAATTGNCSIPQVVAANQLCQLLAGLATPGATSLAFPAALPLFADQSQPTAGNGEKNGAALSDQGFAGNITARYIFSPTLNAYVTYSRGRRPEVLSALAPSTPFGPARFDTVAAETIDNYEGGVKSRFFGGKLSLEGAIYYDTYNNFQTTILEGSQFVTTDAGDETTYGFEGQASWAITPMADVYATYTFTHARFANGIFDGNQPRLTPDHAVTLGGSYRIPAFGGVFDIRPNYRWQSKVFFNDDDGNPKIQEEEGPLVTPIQFNQYQNPYSLVDLRISYAPVGAHWKVEVFGTNITNTHYLKDSGNTGSDIGLPTDIPGEPAFYGVSFTIRR